MRYSYFYKQLVLVNRTNEDSKKTVGDCINTRAEMKRRRTSLQQQPRKSSREKEFIREEKCDIEKPITEGSSEQEEPVSWPQTLIFPEGSVFKVAWASSRYILH